MISPHLESIPASLLFSYSGFSVLVIRESVNYDSFLTDSLTDRLSLSCLPSNNLSLITLIIVFTSLRTFFSISY